MNVIRFPTNAHAPCLVHSKCIRVSAASKRRWNSFGVGELYSWTDNHYIATKIYRDETWPFVVQPLYYCGRCHNGPLRATPTVVCSRFGSATAERTHFRCSRFHKLPQGPGKARQVRNPSPRGGGVLSNCPTLILERPRTTSYCDHDARPHPFCTICRVREAHDKETHEYAPTRMLLRQARPHIFFRCLNSRNDRGSGQEREIPGLNRTELLAPCQIATEVFESRPVLSDTHTTNNASLFQRPYITGPAYA